MSDIAIFVLKRDVKLQPTNLNSYMKKKKSKHHKEKNNVGKMGKEGESLLKFPSPNVMMVAGFAVDGIFW